MTIRKGEPWGEPAVCPTDLRVVPTDRDAARLGDLAPHTRSSRCGDLGVAGGDLARTCGGRRGCASDVPPRCTVDAMRVTLDDGDADVGRRPRRRPPVGGGAARW